MHSSTRSTIRKAVVMGMALLAAVSSYRVYYSYYSRGPIVDFAYDRDGEQVLSLFRQNVYWLTSSDEYDPEYAFRTLSPNKMDKYFGKLKVKVLRDNTKLIGFISYYKKSFYQGFILFLAVDSAYRGNGYAQKLLQHACDDLFAQYVSVIRLVTRPSNIRAQAVYRRLDFVETGRDETFVYFEKKQPRL